MAIFLSDRMLNGGGVIGGYNAGEIVTVTSTIKIPSGTTLTTSDKLLFCRVPEGAQLYEAILRTGDLESSTTTLTLDVGYDRPVVDPSKAYNATTNPYTDNAIGTADVDFIEAAATTGQAGGTLVLSYSGFTVTSQAASGFAGDVDFSITPAASATSAAAADRTVELTLRLLLANTATPGTFSGNTAHKYKSVYS